VRAERPQVLKQQGKGHVIIPGEVSMKKQSIIVTLLIFAFITGVRAQITPRDRYLSPDFQKYSNDPPGDRAADAKKAMKLLDEGIGLYRQKKDAAAMEKYEEALELYAAADIYYHYGNSLVNTGELIYAARAYQFALEYNCSMPALAWYNLACARSLLKHADKACEALGNAILTGYPSIDNVKSDGDLAFVRKDANWNAKFAELKKLFARGETMLPSGKKIEHGVASTVDIYYFCPDGTVKVEYTISEIKNHRKSGRWKFSHYVLTINWIVETGEQGVGKPAYCAAVCEYKAYAPMKKSIVQTETILWKEIDDAHGEQWKVEPITGGCE
jgi:tetratricopeptide (TPR) repeat protein